MKKEMTNKSNERLKLSVNQYDTLRMKLLKSKALAYALTEIVRSDDSDIDSGHIMSLGMMLEENLEEAGNIIDAIT